MQRRRSSSDEAARETFRGRRPRRATGGRLLGHHRGHALDRPLHLHWHRQSFVPTLSPRNRASACPQSRPKRPRRPCQGRAPYSHGKRRRSPGRAPCNHGKVQAQGPPRDRVPSRPVRAPRIAPAMAPVRALGLHRGRLERKRSQMPLLSRSGRARGKRRSTRGKATLAPRSEVSPSEPTATWRAPALSPARSRVSMCCPRCSGRKLTAGGAY
mmetsp:Transcript_56046/g.133996  ORF Transcript_56046/g.133996 Transcript_56046/m.133996 type:complete len:213 (-) Transcript_56046:117-755(-)